MYGGVYMPSNVGGASYSLDAINDIIFKHGYNLSQDMRSIVE